MPLRLPGERSPTVLELTFHHVNRQATH